VLEINRLVELLKIPQDTVEKWLDKASAVELGEMAEESAQKVIDHLNKQIKGEK
jgi:polyhydroxyalkanoate synthesis regulator phasin